MNEETMIWEALQFAVDLEAYATAEKRKHGKDSPEGQYWQGCCDTCRKVTAIMRGSDLYSDLFAGALAERKKQETQLVP